MDNSSMRTHTDRRTFLSTTAKAAAIAAAAAGPAGGLPRILGANDRIRLGVIGPGARGQGVMKHFLATGKVEIAALCDIYDANLSQAQAIAGGKAAQFNDYRRLLETDLDAVLIATPDHWHLAMSVDACAAGKDVYIEKPLTLDIQEGRQIIRSVRLHDRVMQVGMQQRSGEHYREAKSRYFDSGRIGKITIARTWWHGNTYHLRKAPFSEQPAGLDWKAFLGPRPWRDWDVQQFWNWRAYLDFGGGQITDLFTHWIDVVQWFMGQDLPTSAVAQGGVYHYKDGRTAPDTIHVLLQYPGEWTATFEATLAPGVKGAGIEFIGTGGRLEITRGHYLFAPVEGDPERRDVESGDGMTLAHVANFLECMSSRKRPNGDVLHGHRSAQSSHLGNLAYLDRRRIEFDPIREQILES